MRTGASRVSSGFGELYPKKESLALSIIRFAHCRGIDRNLAPIPLQPSARFHWSDREQSGQTFAQISHQCPTTNSRRPASHKQVSAPAFALRIRR